MIRQREASLMLTVSLQLGLTSRRMVLSTGEKTSHNVLYLAYVLALSLSCFIPAMLILTLEEQES